MTVKLGSCKNTYQVLWAPGAFLPGHTKVAASVLLWLLLTQAG